MYSPIWSTHNLYGLRILENTLICWKNVQIRAIKLVDGLENMDYPERLKRLNLPTLVYRRLRGDMIEIYKHFHTYDKEIISQHHSSHGSAPPENTIFRSSIESQKLGYEEFNRIPFTTDHPIYGTTCQEQWLSLKILIRLKISWISFGKKYRLCSTTFLQSGAIHRGTLALSR